MVALAGTAGNLAVRLASADAFDVRELVVHERLSALFEVTALALCANPSVDFEAAVGKPASFALTGPFGAERSWAGLCNGLVQTATEPSGLTTYRITIVPTLWLATQRRNYRVFQQMSEPQIVQKLLAEWEIDAQLKIDQGAYKPRKYRVQYGESDYAFICRMLEDAGISFYFDAGAPGAPLVLSDAPQSNPPRLPPIPFRDSAARPRGHYVSAVQAGRQLRPGRYTMRDHDYRRPADYELEGGVAAQAVAAEAKLERYHYVPGAFLFRAQAGEDTPSADDKGKTRAQEPEAKALAQRRLDAQRGPASRVAFSTNAHDLGPGVVMSILDHPRADLGAGKPLLVVESSIVGYHDADWVQSCEAQSAVYRPPLDTPRPRALGVESATVVGPAGEEIHCDEFGRVRVQFHWDRAGKRDDNSSCWIHVAQPWSGAGWGAITLPRIGQEVLVQFLGADPDRPVVVGRVYTNLQKVPYKLPEHRTRSGWRTSSTCQTGGYNEIMLEDKAGEELFGVQAERDFRKLVKHDETIDVGNDRSLTVGRNHTKLVNENEREVTGMNRSVTVGVDRSTRIDGCDGTKVGGRYTVAISRGDEDSGGGSSTSVTMEQGKIVLSTGEGATITLEGGKVKIEGDSIELRASGSITAKPPVTPG
ncbi:MAG: type VI secretion system tip protein VgrG [Deltaproteobacteria bacterium]|nr:type VI secretion system tip protein VgrG [Deltaproteobacteria bacterium]